MGRPPKSSIDGVFTKLWFENAARQAGGVKPYWFWKNVALKQGNRSTWVRYKTGLRVPKSHGDDNPIDKVDKILPGTARLFHSPVRVVLKGGRLRQADAAQAISEIGDPIKRIILEGGYEPSSADQNDDRNTEAMFEQLSLFPSLAQLEAIILLLGWADDIGNSELWNYICGFYRHMIPELIRVGNVPFFDELCDLIDDVAQLRTFNSVNYRKDIYQSWRDDRPKHLIRQDELTREMVEYFNSMKQHNPE